MERLWRDLKDQLAASLIPPLEELSEAVGGIVQRYSQATLRSLTGFAYFVQAIETA
jgi:hypothetical protein